MRAASSGTGVENAISSVTSSAATSQPPGVTRLTKRLERVVTASSHGAGRAASPPTGTSPAQRRVYVASAASALAGRRLMSVATSSGVTAASAMTPRPPTSEQAPATSAACTWWLKPRRQLPSTGRARGSAPVRPSTSSGWCTKLNWKPPVRRARSPASATRYVVAASAPRPARSPGCGDRATVPPRRSPGSPSTVVASTTVPTWASSITGRSKLTSIGSLPAAVRDGEKVVTARSWCCPEPHAPSAAAAKAVGMASRAHSRRWRTRAWTWAGSVIG